MLDAFIWFLTIEILGLLALPATFVLFKRLPDRGYAFGKALSILLISFLLWITASAHILPNHRWAIFLIIILLAAISAFLYWRRRHEIKAYISENRTVILFTEGLFLFCFAFWAVVRSYNPDILYGEKMMDIAYINAIIRSDNFPPYDPWLSGYFISYYYYFGYLMMATLTKLTGVASQVAFNLSLATLFAITVTGGFSLVYNLVRLMKGGLRAALGFGLAGAAFLAVIGNLEGILEVFRAHGGGSSGFWRWVDINGLENPYYSTTWYPSDHWWWWRASRVIGLREAGIVYDYTINDFPFFSHFFADLHAHLIAVPFVLLNMAVGLELFLSPISLGLKWIRRNWGKLIVFAICLGSLVFLNSWDLPTYAFLFVVLIALGEYLRRGKLDRKYFIDVIVFCVVLVGLAVLFYIPYTKSMLSATGRLASVGGGGQGVIFGLAPYYGYSSRYLHLFIFWGLFLFLTFSLIVAQSWGMLRHRNVGRWAIAGAVAIPLLPFIVWAITVNWDSIRKWLDSGPVFALEKFGHLLPVLIILSLIILLVVKKSQSIVRYAREGGRAHIFVLAIIFVGLLGIMGCELFFMDDRGSGPYERLTAVFKLYYQAWIFLAVASGACLYWLASRWRQRQTVIPTATSAPAIWTYAALGLAMILSAIIVLAVTGGPLTAILMQLLAIAGALLLLIAIRGLHRRRWEVPPLPRLVPPLVSLLNSIEDSISSLLRGAYQRRLITAYGILAMVASCFVAFVYPSTLAGMVALFIAGLLLVLVGTGTLGRRPPVGTGAAGESAVALPRRIFNTVWWVVCILLIIGCSVYPVAALYNKTDSYRNSARVGPTLNGMNWVRYNYPSEYEAITWLNDEAEGSPVVVEGVGSHYAGWFWVSSFTGLPTIVGRWGQVPDWLIDVDPQEKADRERAADTIYTSNDSAEVQMVLERYDVVYIYLGFREQAKYGANMSQQFTQFTDVIFENEGVTIYQVRNQ